MECTIIVTFVCKAVNVGKSEFGLQSDYVGAKERSITVGLHCETVKYGYNFEAAEISDYCDCVNFTDDFDQVLLRAKH